MTVLPSTRYLLEQDFPGMRIGPEPTTDSFIAVMQGEMEGIIPGNALVVDPKKPFRKLNAFGNAFLNRWVQRERTHPGCSLFSLEYERVEQDLGRPCIFSRSGISLDCPFLSGNETTID